MIFADDLVGARKDDLSATLLAALHPNWTIYHSDASTQGLVHRPIMERLYPFGLTIEPPEGAAVDSWERAARVVHQTYLASLGDKVDPSKPAQRSWEELSSFYRASNVRLVTATLAAAESVGRTWGPTSTGLGDSASTAVDPGQLQVMAEFEHESWRRFYLEQGWSYGPSRNDAKRVHNALVPWSDLASSYRERAIGNVKAALGTLHALGYRSSMASDRPWTDSVNGSARFGRRCWKSDWRWQTATGEWLQARAGDYQVSNGTGEAWSVEPKIFAQSYEHIQGDRWRRIGEVSAQPAMPGELVDHSGRAGDRGRRRLGDQRRCGRAVDHLRGALRGQLRAHPLLSRAWESCDQSGVTSPAAINCLGRGAAVGPSALPAG